MGAYKDGDTWRSTFYYGVAERRKKKNKRGFQTKREALEWEREFLSKYNYSQDMKFISLYELYIEDARCRLRQGSIETRNRAIKRWVLPYFKNKTTCEIDNLSIRTWQNELLSKSISNGTKRNVNSYLRSVFEYGVSCGIINKNPVSKISLSNTTKEKSIITEYELNLLIEKEKKEYIKHAMIILFWTGVRSGELLGLKFSDFNFEKRTLKIERSLQFYEKDIRMEKPKTDKGNRTIAISDKVIQSVKRLKELHYGEEDFLFPPSRRGNLYCHLRNLGKACGIENLGVHTFRHSHASYLFSKGVNVLLISKRLGHADVSTTLNTYTHILEGMEKQLIDVLE